jgi:hypothetical protein
MVRGADENHRLSVALEVMGMRGGGAERLREEAAGVQDRRGEQKQQLSSVAHLRIPECHEGKAAKNSKDVKVKRDSFPPMKATLPEPEIVMRKGKPVSVIIPIKDYEELLERVEDAGDVAWLKRARKTPLPYRPLEDYLAERKRK